MPIATNPTLTHRPQLLAPAGNWECAKAAIENGADAIYFGLERFNARMRAENFTAADLPELMAWLHQRGVKGYVTLNTLIFTQELPAVEQYLRSIILAGVDAAIVQDAGICRLIRHLSPDFPIHASTQMTVTSAAGVEFAHELGCDLVVLARECSLTEIEKIQSQLGDREISIPLEVFVHGALCVAYSGQCLTSESLGGRSANRGECAQACRMPYDLIVDDELYTLGDKKYLLSPQDLAGISVLPEIVKTGVSCLKIEGRLKTPEYVASVTRVYRSALDQICENLAPEIDRDTYNLEMAFSRGLYTGWFQGIDNQALVHARFGKKRGVYLGEVTRVYADREAITLNPIADIKAGDGIVFDCGHPEVREEGGRVYEVFKGNGNNSETMLSFGRGAVNFRQVSIGDHLWKTSDPELDKKVRQTYAGDVPQFQRSIDLEIHGEVNQPLIAIARDEMGHVVHVESELLLVPAQNQPLTDDKLNSQLGRLGNTPFCLGNLTNHLVGDLMLPVSALNHIRRELVNKLTEVRSQPKQWQLSPTSQLKDLLPEVGNRSLNPPQLIILVRKLDQIPAAIASGAVHIYCELEDPRKYREAVQLVRAAKQTKINPPQIFVAPPRITKTGENWILEQVRSSDADGYLIRNYDQLEFFKSERCVGDFALNVANPLTADHFYQNYTLERLTASYDLNIDQLTALIRSCPRDWFEVTIHQHMPMFHMEHCVFCAFLSEGTDYTNCGRPCEEHQVKLRDRVGTEHILQADAGCRNTVFNGVAQTGAEYIHRLIELGVYNFRIEFVDESPAQISQTIGYYQQLLGGQISGAKLWQDLNLIDRLGVTRGSLGV
jgi:U32 family peptidase